ncbi:hypothetical protein SLEP1_g55775 [Rubroshorea leprosula]|uniref:Methyltransferase FkbM domain-containing protein n=1 Tax=Rubroshorea leprosula TaxID=152421 RepID=A0AAV5MJL9_9ROSI|nr:hypothetical protein SLEP1_g55775 [Rubroshorea leprosula]
MIFSSGNVAFISCIDPLNIFSTSFNLSSTLLFVDVEGTDFLEVGTFAKQRTLPFLSDPFTLKNTSSHQDVVSSNALAEQVDSLMQFLSCSY